ncbi:hypothetical protein PS013_23960, partial [Shigella sonnei]|nr:hypothetical protein [Shigella sonnei]
NAIIVILSSVIGGMLACGYILLRHATCKHPSNAIIVILSSVIGGMLACGYILLRHAMEARKMSVIE